MKLQFSNKLSLIVLFLTLSVYNANAENIQRDSINFSTEQILSEARKIRHQNPESSIALLQQAHEASLKSGDTLQAVNILLEMTDVYGNLANYAKAYDGFWKALFLTDNLDNDALRGFIYNSLGRLYSFYKRKDEAFKYLQTSLDINKNLVKKGELTKPELVLNYYAFCSTYREFNEPVLAKKYLDSCFIYYKNIPNQVAKASLQFEKAFIFSQEEKSIEALGIMESIEPWFKENSPSYLVLVYSYWGDIYKKMSDFDSSKKYYNLALETSKKYNSHIDFTPLVYGNLADLYLQKGDYKNAFANQQIAKDLDDLFFGSRSENNKPLLEIKDEFRLEKERQLKLIQKQRLEKLEQDDKISFLQRVILGGTIVFLLVMGIVYFNYIRSRHKAEKQLIRRNKELEIQKAEELLELKNKELAASALQLVEKDEFLNLLKSRLKGNNDNIKTSEINQIIKSISISNDNNWEEFKLRFTAVNEKFYQKISLEYPKLSQADQKICALIKLNFSSKKMAKLLGVSVESVHTTRYRLRKKLGLPRSTNLEDFIASL